MTSFPPTEPAPRDRGDTPFRRVVVTGVGLRTSLGRDAAETWGAIRNGRSGAAVVELPGIGPVNGCPARWGGDGGPVDPLRDLIAGAGLEALRDADLFPTNRVEPERVATLIGLSKGDIRGLGMARRLADDPGADPDALGALWPATWPGGGAGAHPVLDAFRGPRLAPVAACATGLVAVLRGADLIRRGACDVALAGSADASLEPLLIAAFRKMRALAREDVPPTAAARPWDRARSGFIVGEGAAFLVLEREDHARARGVLPYAELAGGALGSDAYHLTDLDPDPDGLAHLIRRALSHAGVASDQIDHINVHGTATRQNDPLECRAIRLALGPDAGRVACTANKAQIGHLLGAAGSAELAITCLSIRDGFVPPTLNLEHPDPSCDLDGTPLVGRRQPIRAALKLSLGFGGHLAAAVLKRPDGPWRGGDHGG